ncbi:MAG: type II toxin-antitoxin system RelE/ParE family toxin [Prevotella sp.]|nr:type II toxin-antitoxin system RelE/ParE family toxin [Prevotella sp.]
MKENCNIRELYFSNEFWEFYQRQQDKVKRKFDYVIDIVRKERIITSKFIKHLEGTDFYEMRISIGTNEYRTVLFAINHSNIISATKILVLNAFLKKSTKDYNKQIEIATKILGGFKDD